MRRDTRTLPALSGLEVGLTHIPEDAELSLEYRLESVLDGVLVTGTVEAPMAGECARCLDPVSETLTGSFQELFRYPEDDHGTANEPEHDVGADDDSDYHLEGDWIDLEPVIRDALVPALPDSPLCRDDCPGLCVECGVRLADAGPDHSHEEAVDPRWAALKRLDSSTKE